MDILVTRTSLILNTASVPLVSGIALFVAVSSISLITFLNKKVEKVNYLDEFLLKGVPVTAASIFEREDKDIIAINLGDDRVLLIRDPAVASHILKTNSKNYIERLANDDGLKILGMFENGIIWNNDNKSWGELRKIFQESIDRSSIDKASLIAAKEVRTLILDELSESNSVETDILKIFRITTLRTTLQVFFAIRLTDEEELKLIDAIIKYFKAWEYSLIRPVHKYDQNIVNTIKDNIKIFRQYINDFIISPCRDRRDVTDPKLFINKLILSLDSNIDASVVEQCVLEMLIAGTDTSSVSAFYCILGLGDCCYSSQSDSKTSFQDTLYQDLSKKRSELNCYLNEFEWCRLLINSSKNSDYMISLIYETLRFKPVGPVIIRRAVDGDYILGGDNCDPIFIKKCDGVIIDVEKLSRKNELFPNADTYDPLRFLSDHSDEFNPNVTNSRKNMFPFGAGVKGCIGQYLGLAEMRAMISVSVSMCHIKTKTTLKDIDTHWDIANQPTQIETVFLTRRITSIIITGASSTGKTFLMNSIYRCLNSDTNPNKIQRIEEVARIIMQSKKWNQDILIDSIKTDFKIFNELQELVITSQRDKENEFESQGFISDRGLDALAYLLLYPENSDGHDMFNRLIESDVVKNISNRYKLSVVIIIDPTAECYYNDGVRILPTSLVELKMFNELLINKVLNRLNIPFLRIKSEIPLDKRCGYVLEHYKAAGGLVP